MVAERIPNKNDNVNASVLGEEIKFRSGKVARNRFLKASLTERISTYSDDFAKRGLPTQQLINLYQRWGNGGFGVVLTGNVMTHPTQLEAPGNVVICKENNTSRMVELLHKYATVSKEDGALAIVQLGNAGRQTPFAVNPTPFAASAVALDMPTGTGIRFGKPVELTIEEIKTEVIDRFVFAARAAQIAGFDGVQIHGAHGYLISGFVSPTTNKRTDKYGGSPQNRTRIIVEIYEAIRAEIPESTGFLVGIKLNSCEFQNEGISTDDAKVVCQIIEDTGFDFVELSGGNYEQLAFHHMKESTKKREAYFLEFADQLRVMFKKTRVYVTGGFRTVTGMVEAIESGSCEGIGLGRPITAEPDLPKKILNGIVRSAPDTKIDNLNFALTLVASNTQMARAGWKTLEEANGDVMADIPDLSNNDIYEKYMGSVMGYIAESIEATDSGKVMSKVFEFEEFIETK